MPTSKVDLFAAIRRDSHAGMSGRTIAQKYQVSRRTVRAALTSAWPQPRKPMPPRASKLDPFKPVIDDMLRVDDTWSRRWTYAARSGCPTAGPAATADRCSRGCRVCSRRRSDHRG